MLFGVNAVSEEKSHRRCIQVGVPQGNDPATGGEGKQSLHRLKQRDGP